MAITVRGTATVQKGTATSLSISEPASLGATDRIIMVVAHTGGIQITGTPYGWKLLSSSFPSGYILRVFQYTPGGTGAVAAPWTFQFVTSGGVSTAATYIAATFALIPDPATGGTWRPTADAYTVSTSSASATTATCPSVTPGTANDLTLVIAAQERGTTFTPPAGVTEIVDDRTGNTVGDLSLFVGTKALATAAGVATGTFAVTLDNPYSLVAGTPGVATVTTASAGPPGSWNGDVSTGDFSQYESFEAAAAGRGVVAADAAFRSGYRARLTVLDDDITPLTSTSNPRAAMNSRYLIGSGDEKWFTYSLRLPSDFPQIPYFPDGWIVFFQMYGAPFIGSPNLAIASNGDNLVVQEFGRDMVWSTPMQRGSLHEFVLRVKFGDPGWIEGFHNVGGLNGPAHTPMRFINVKRGVASSPVLPGRRQYPLTTMTADNIDGLKVIPMSYRKHGFLESVTFDLGDATMNTTPPSWLAAADTARVKAAA